MDIDLSWKYSEVVCNLKALKKKYEEIFDLSQDEAISMSKMVKGYSYAFQLLGTLLWESGKKRINDDIIGQFDAMLYDGSYKAIWDHLTEREKDIIIAIAHAEEGKVKRIREKVNMESNQFSPYRNNLKEYGLIYTSNYGEIHFSLPRFTEFVLRVEMYS